MSLNWRPGNKPMHLWAPVFWWISQKYKLENIFTTMLLDKLDGFMWKNSNRLIPYKTQLQIGKRTQLMARYILLDWRESEEYPWTNLHRKRLSEQNTNRTGTKNNNQWDLMKLKSIWQRTPSYRHIDKWVGYSIWKNFTNYSSYRVLTSKIYHEL